MEEKMESEGSVSGESDSSSGSSSGSSEGEEEALEPVRILGETFELPPDLCEDYGVFREFFSKHTWDALSDDNREELKKYLPQFPENDKEEKEKTIKMLFDNEPFHFTSPLDNLYKDLRQGNYRPDIAKMRKFLRRARAKQQRHKMKSYYAKLLPEVLLSRERLLAAAMAAPPGPVPRLPALPKKPSAKNHYKPLHARVRQRYFEELSAIRGEVGGEVSDDENYPEGPPQPVKKKKQLGTAQNQDGNISGTLGGSEAPYPTSMESLKSVLATHRARRRYRENHPELNVAGISLEDVKQRVACVNGAKKLMFGGQKVDTPIQKVKRGPKKDPSKQMKQAEARSKKKEQHECVENKPLLPNIKIKCEQEDTDSESSSFVDPVTSPKPRKILDQVEIKQEVVDMKYPNATSVNYNEPDLDSLVKEEPQEHVIPVQNPSRIVQPVPIKLEDLDGIDMMALPVEIADDPCDVVPDADDALTETTHANFLSLVRALFPAKAAHRATKQQLYARCAAVMRSPIAPLNTWYNLSRDWCAELGSALAWLAGERGPHPDDFVPYLQFKPDTQMYQWIGAGRDCDAILGRLCERWLQASSRNQASRPTQQSAITPRVMQPPPPKYPTSWVVRQPTSAEIAEFRSQERRRFAAAAKPFTYSLHGYRAVVGPCARATLSGGNSNVLVADRPRHANLLALVRDAVARLPNGEGTTSHVVTLLKMSQWIAPCSEQTLLSAVTNALDRLHAAKRDTMLKYDQRTTVWTYLHRHRSEEEWLRNSGPRARVRPTPPRPAPAPRDVPTIPTRQTPPHAMEVDIGGKEDDIDNETDTDVDVDDSGSPTTTGPRLSSAQLLMQAAPANPISRRPQVTQKQDRLANLATHAANQPKLATSKGTNQKTPAKQTSKSSVAKPTPPQKQAGSEQMKQSTIAAQIPKQSTIGAQATKQINIGAQATKQSNIGAQATKQSNIGAQATKQSNIGAQATKQSNIGAQATKQSNIGAQATKQSNIGAQATKQSNIGAQATKQSIIGAQATKQSNIGAQATKQSNIGAQATKQSNIGAQATKQSNIGTPATKQSTIGAQDTKQTTLGVQATKQTNAQKTPTNQPQKQSPATKQPSFSVQTTKQAALMAQSAKQASVIAQLTKQTAAKIQKQINVAKQAAHNPKQTAPPPKQSPAKQGTSPKQEVMVAAKSTPTLVAAPHKSPLITQRPLLKQVESSQAMASMPNIPQQIVQAPSVIQPAATVVTVQNQSKPVTQGTRSLLIRPPAVQTTVTAVPVASTTNTQRRGVVRVLSPAAGSIAAMVAGAGGKSLISPRALLPTQPDSVAPSAHGTPTTKKRATVSDTPSVTTVAQNASNATAVVSSVATVMTSSAPTRTVQLAGGRTVQLANQTVHLPGGQTVQLSSGHTLQLSSLHLPTHSVRLPNGQTVQLASPQAVQAIRAATAAKAASQRAHATSPTVKPPTSIPQLSTVQLAGQTVQIAGQSVQIAGQSVHLTGHTVKLPSGQSVQVASQSVLPSQVQLPSGQTVQLGQNVLSNQLGGNVQLGAQTVHLGGQTVQLGGQTVQLSSGQTVQLSSGQTLQLASGQTVQLANQGTKQIAQVVRTQPAEKAPTVMAKLLTNAQGQMVSLEGAGAGTVPTRSLQVSGVRVLPSRLARPLILHNMLLPQSDGAAARGTSAGGPATTQAIMISTIGAQTVTTSSTSAPVLKLQQVNPLQQVKLAQGIKLQQASSTSTAGTTNVRSVVMDGQQLKLVGGRHVLARILRPAQPQ